MEVAAAPTPIANDVVAAAWELAENQHKSNVFAVTTLALVLYEYFITLGDELEYIHKAERSLPKVAFLVNRYFVLLLTVFQNLQLSWPLDLRPWCPYGLAITAAAAVLASCIVGFILLLRLYAFYNRSRRLLLFLSATYIACTTASLVGIVAFARVKVPPSLSDEYPTACVSPPSPKLWLVILPTVLFDTVVVVLTVVRARRLREQEHTPIITHLYCTGVGYYLVTLACNSFLAVVFHSAGSTTIHSAIVAPATTLPSAVSSIICTRMLLALRAKVERRSASPEIPESELRRASASTVTIVAV